MMLCNLCLRLSDSSARRQHRLHTLCDGHSRIQCVVASTGCQIHLATSQNRYQRSLAVLFRGTLHGLVMTAYQWLQFNVGQHTVLRSIPHDRQTSLLNTNITVITLSICHSLNLLTPGVLGSTAKHSATGGGHPSNSNTILQCNGIQLMTHCQLPIRRSSTL